MRNLFFAVMALGMSSLTALAQNLSLTCQPQDGGGRIEIAIEGASWRVTHVTAAGARYERAEQYFFHNTTPTRWQGNSIRAEGRSMVGTLAPVGGGSFAYEEAMFDRRRGPNPVSLSGALCHPAAVAAPAAGRALHQWEGSKHGTRSYSVEGFEIKLSAVKMDGNDVARLEANAPGYKPLVLVAEDGGFSASANFDIFPIDPRHSRKDLLFTYFTGGAHCCGVAKVASWINGEWKVVRVEDADGDLRETRPMDINGDGQVDFVGRDDSFLYAFSSYAESATPVKVLNVENGAVVDRSADPAFAALHRQTMARLAPECRRGSNSACAAYVASAARVGGFEAAWQFMLRHHAKRTEWDMQICALDDKTCKNSRSTRNFPEALANLLRRGGYIAR